MKCPCEECIRYAICVSRKYIYCELLYNYARAYTDTDKEFWRLIHKTVPRCEELSKDGMVAIYYDGGIGLSGTITG